MEAVAAVSSVVGILSFAGQALNGIVKLRGFFNEYASASKSIDRFLRDLNSLIQTLEDVKEIAVKLDDVSGFDAKSMLASLEIQLEDCAKDVYHWVRIGGDNRPESVKGCKAVFTKFLVASSKDSMVDISRAIASHKDNINLKLSAIGRSLDIEHTTKIDSVNSKISEMAAATTAGNQITSEALKLLESQISQPRSDMEDSPSLQSLVGAVSRIESLLSSHPGSVRSRAPSIGSRRGSASNFSWHPPQAGSWVGSNSSSIGIALTTGLSEVGGREQINSPIPFPNSATQQTWNAVIPNTTLPPILTQDRSATEEAIPDGNWPSKSLQDIIPGGDCPASVGRYINLIHLFRVLNLHSKLLPAIYGTFPEDSDVSLNKNKQYQQLPRQLEHLKQELQEAREKCWLEGYDLEEIHEIVTLDSFHGIDTKYNQNSNLVALRTRVQQLKEKRGAWLNRQNRINAWLLQKLAASEEDVVLHRSFLTNSKELDEKQWARLVLKYWPLDEAAVETEGRALSTNGAEDSGKGRYTVRVLLEMAEKDWEDPWLTESGSSGGVPLEQLVGANRRTLFTEAGAVETAS